MARGWEGDGIFGSGGGGEGDVGPAVPIHGPIFKTRFISFRHRIRRRPRRFGFGRPPRPRSPQLLDDPQDITLLSPNPSGHHQLTGPRRPILLSRDFCTTLTQIFFIFQDCHNPARMVPFATQTAGHHTSHRACTPGGCQPPTSKPPRIPHDSPPARVSQRVSHGSVTSSLAQRRQALPHLPSPFLSDRETSPRHQRGGGWIPPPCATLVRLMTSYALIGEYIARFHP